MAAADRSLEEQIVLLNESGGLPTFAGRNLDDVTDQEIRLAFIQSIIKIENAKLELAAHGCSVCAQIQGVNIPNGKPD